MCPFDVYSFTKETFITVLLLDPVLLNQTVRKVDIKDLKGIVHIVIVNIQDQGKFTQICYKFLTGLKICCRRSRSGSTSSYKKHQSKSSRRSKSPDRYRRKESRPTNRRHSRSKSQQRSRRSRSRSYIREYTSKPKRRSSSRSSSSSSNYSSSDKTLRNKSQTSSKIRSYEKGGSEIKLKVEDKMTSTVSSKVLDELNSDSFAPKQFTSNKSKKLPDNIVIDLKKQTIKVPEVEPVEPDSVFHHTVSLNLSTLELFLFFLDLPMYFL